MLAAMKRRKLQEPLNLAVARIVSPDDGEPRIVSHVPPVSATSSLRSSSSTISSAQYNHPQPLSCKGDNEAHEGEPPLLSPIVSVGVKGPASSESSPKEPEVAKLFTSNSMDSLKRNISFVSGDNKARFGQESKRPRIEASARPHAKESSLTESQRPLLLSTVKDASVLSPLHIFVRQQIEVFQATEEDLKQPAPGRRIPIQLNQVGLRCIHCKHQKARERKKRAVCYPSSVGRVYHSISDMKFAHFPCQQMPQDLQQKFAALKEESLIQSRLNKESGSKRIGSATASTAQYYHDSARELGMVDGKGGIYAHSNLPLPTLPTTDGAAFLQSELAMSYAALSQASVLQGILLGKFMSPFALVNVASGRQDHVAMTKIPKNDPVGMARADAMVMTKAPKSVPIDVPIDPQSMAKTPAVIHKMPQRAIDTPRVILASAMDQHYLTPIHCFVRKHVEAFAADEQDLAAPAPGRKKPIVLGQVGLRCVHCARLPIKQRVKRAICFPPSVSGVYHAVSNMKFDHFKLCKGMPQEAREEFQQISSSPSSSSSSTGGKRGSGDSKSPRVSNSTAQYYHDSALRLGLCDTQEGIRFDQVSVHQKAGDTIIAAHEAEGMEALIIAATDPKVRAAHEQRKPRRPAA